MKTIAAIATPPTTGGIGIIRISGDTAVEVGGKVFQSADKTPLTEVKGYHAKFGHVVCKGEVLDQAIALVFRAPHSYTGEDVVELSCHGGLFGVSQVLEAVLASGAVVAEAGEFTKRAFLNGKMDLTGAESVMSLISAQGESSKRAALGALEGNLYKKIKEVLEKLLDASANMAAWVDYPDDEIPELNDENLLSIIYRCETELKSLLKNYNQGQAILEGIDTAIVGRPNAGKSTLMNLLVGREKSIVTEIPGTTRDVVEESVRLGNLVLHLSDTAGLRQSTDTVERIGIERAYDKIKKATLIFAVFDSSQELNDGDFQLIEMCRGRQCVAIVNKTDLESKISVDELRVAFDNIVFISAKDEKSIPGLIKVTEKIAGTEEFCPSQPMLANIRQKSCCQSALEALGEAEQAMKSGITMDAVNVSIDDAIDHLLDLTGEKAKEAVVNQVFSNFCVGK